MTVNSSTLRHQLASQKKAELNFCRNTETNKVVLIVSFGGIGYDLKEDYGVKRINENTISQCTTYSTDTI